MNYILKTPKHYHFLCVCSTQKIARIWASSLLKQQAFPSLFKGILIKSDQQLQGEGARGDTWISPPGNIYGTFIFLWPKAKKSLFPFISMVGSLAIVDIFKKFGIIAHIKWVNDIMVQGKKIGGMLGENYGDLKEFPFMIGGFGIGLNLNTQKHVLDKIDQPSTSFFDITNKKIDPNTFWKEIIQKIPYYFSLLLENGFCYFHPLINENLFCLHEEVIFLTHGKKIKGILKEIDHKGGLILREKNQEHVFYTGKLVGRNSCMLK